MSKPPALEFRIRTHQAAIHNILVRFGERVDADRDIIDRLESEQNRQLTEEQIKKLKLMMAAVQEEMRQQLKHHRKELADLQCELQRRWYGKNRA